jgi:hypothetical protein
MRRTTVFRERRGKGSGRRGGKGRPAAGFVSGVDAAATGA